MAMDHEHYYEPVSSQRLWLGLGLSVVAWIAHLTGAYALQSVSCHWGFLVHYTILGVNALRFVLLVFTGLAAIGVVSGGLISYRSYRELLAEKERREVSEPEGRFLFMTQTGVFLSGLFFLSIFFSLFPLLFLEPCARFWW